MKVVVAFVAAALRAAASIPTVRLNNGVEMPVVAAGTAGFNDSEATVAVRNALRANLTAIHTALDYFNLKGVGLGLQEVPREEAFVISMTPPCVHSAPPARNVTDPAACEALTTRELEAVLADLGVASLDLVMLHGPSEPFGFEGACSRAVCGVNAAQWRAYEAFLSAGKTRAIGVSNFCQSCLACLPGTTPATNQLQRDPRVAIGAFARVDDERPPFRYTL